MRPMEQNDCGVVVSKQCLTIIKLYFPCRTCDTKMNQEQRDAQQFFLLWLIVIFIFWKYVNNFGWVENQSILSALVLNIVGLALLWLVGALSACMLMATTNWLSDGHFVMGYRG